MRRHRTRFECLECRRIFWSPSLDPRCPRCGGVDLDVADLHPITSTPPRNGPRTAFESGVLDDRYLRGEF